MKFVAIFSPELEKSVLTSSLSPKDFVILLDKAIKLCNDFKHVVTLMIPSSFKGFLASSQLGLDLLGRLSEDFQSSHLFVPDKKSDLCKVDPVDSLFSSELHGFIVKTHRLVQGQLLIGNKPFLLRSNNIDISSFACNGCGDSSFLCSRVVEYIFYEPFLDKREDLKSFIKQNKTWFWSHYRSGKVTRDSLCYLAFTQSFFIGMEKEYLALIGRISVSDGFLHDISGVSFDELKQVSFSVFSACAFSSVRDKRNRLKYSIDWHTESVLPKVGQTKVYRGDVIEAGRTGVGGSGTKRILMGIKDGKRIVVGYEGQHDFTSHFIKSRIEKSFK